MSTTMHPHLLIRPAGALAPVLGLVLGLGLAGAVPGDARANDLTVNVVGQPGGSAPPQGAGNSDSVLPQLQPSGLGDAQVTVTNLQGGMTPLGPPPTTGPEGTLVVRDLDPGVYEVEVTSGGTTGVTYVVVGGTGGGPATTAIDMTSQPETGVTNGGFGAIQGLTDDAVGAGIAGDRQAHAAAMNQLQAAAQLNEAAAAQLQGIADSMIDGLLGAISGTLKRNLEGAESPGAVNEAINNTIAKIASDVAKARKAAEAAGLEYQQPMEIYDHIRTLQQLEGVLNRAGEHEAHGEKARQRHKEIKKMEADARAAAEADRRTGLIGNLQRSGIISRGPRVTPRRTMGEGHHRRGESPGHRGGLRLVIPGGN